MRLKDARVVVLGGTGGFGFAAAQAALAEGARVLIASSNPDRVRAGVESLGGRAEGRTVDITDEAALAAFFDEAGALDHLVAAVGDPLPRASFRSTPASGAKGAFDVRFWGQYEAARLAAERIDRRGSITLTSGTSSQRGILGFVLGGAACGAVEALTRQLAVELAPVRVNAVSAGVVETPLWSGMPEQQRRVFFENQARRLPVGRVGQPEDIGRAYLYLMTNGFSTGSVLVVDGGALAAGA